jgi:hypothetical protein
MNLHLLARLKTVSQLTKNTKSFLSTQIKARRMNTSSAGQKSTSKAAPMDKSVLSSVNSDFEENTTKQNKKVSEVREERSSSSATINEKEEFDHSAFLSNWQWLTEYGPGFPVPSDQVVIIQSPDKFYTCLLEKTKLAKRRISLASLYLGSGLQEQKLVRHIMNIIFWFKVRHYTNYPFCIIYLG